MARALAMRLMIGRLMGAWCALWVGVEGVAAQSDVPRVIEPEGAHRIKQIPGSLGQPEPRLTLDAQVVGPPPEADAPEALREGAFIVNRPGRVREMPGSGHRVFVPSEMAGQPDLPAMILQPSRELGTIVSWLESEDAQGDDRLMLSGQVHRYRGLHYLTVTRVQPVLKADEPAEGEARDVDELGPDEDEAQDPLERLLEQRELAPEVREDRPAREGRDRMVPAVAGSAPHARDGQGELRREGELLLERRGRLVRSSDGGHVLFSFDGDGRESPEPPMIVLPNQLRERMEQLVQARGREMSFYISGQVYTYGEANHVLITSMRLVPDAGNLR